MWYLGYYKVQGLAFILLVSSLIHREFSEHVKKAGIRESIQDVLLDSSEKLDTSLTPDVPASSKS